MRARAGLGARPNRFDCGCMAAPAAFAPEAVTGADIAESWPALRCRPEFRRTKAAKKRKVREGKPRKENQGGKETQEEKKSRKKKKTGKNK